MAPAARKSDDTAKKFSPPASPARSFPVHQNGSFWFPNSDLKSTRTLLSQLDSKPEFCRDDGVAPSHIPVEGGHHG